MEKLKLPISVLDLVPILEGQTATDALHVHESLLSMSMN